MGGGRIGVLFVCLGNICRSPAAEGTFRYLAAEAGLLQHFEIDSAGTAAYHTGESPNSRSTKTAARRGIQLAGRARQFDRADFTRFDYILAMDRSNYQDILAQARDQAHRDRVMMFRRFDPVHGAREPDVPDPYYGGPEGFEEVQDIMLASGARLLDWLCERHSLRGREPKTPRGDGVEYGQQ